MYHENAKRIRVQAGFSDYGEYLDSLEMKAVIKPFEPHYTARIAQLANKSNQFNLTTKRYTQGEIEEISNDADYITLYGKLEDKFGDNGVVSVCIGHMEGGVCHITLWLMSCRVLKRDMEYAMMDSVVDACKECGIGTIIGYYYPTAKNAMVKEFYAAMGFEKINEAEDGSTIWQFAIPSEYQKKNTVIDVKQ